MADQHIIVADTTPAATDPATASGPATITLPTGFHLQSVDGNLENRKEPDFATQPVPLGVLSNFTGNFAGTGFNLIFRPNSAAPTTTIFPNPVTPTPPTPPSENVLELNLTTETLSFSAPLGRVPNRGLESQNDIFLNGVSYVQAISDVTNPVTGKGDGKAAAIHFEPGLWMHIPATKNDPVLGESLVRMASIPHGTTINAEGLAPGASSTIAGPPDFTKIPPVDITPFPIGTVQAQTQLTGVFKAQDAANTDTPRLPQDLTKFIAAGTITQDILNNPNVVLANAIKNQTITQTIVFTVSTTPASPELGGGTANIAFLQGAPSGTTPEPNANAAQMSATFWIETVQHKILVPVWRPGQPPLRLRGNASQPGAIVPTFVGTPPKEITAPKTITVTSTQIQYSQLVFLNFATLTWPHVSVATLVPTTEQTIPITVWN